jgi:hypothetical protein
MVMALQTRLPNGRSLQDAQKNCAQALRMSASDSEQVERNVRRRKVAGQGTILPDRD